MDDECGLIREALEEIDLDHLIGETHSQIETPLNQVCCLTSLNNNSEPISTSSIPLMSMIETSNQREFASSVNESYNYAQNDLSHDSQSSQISIDSEFINHFIDMNTDSPQPPQDVSQVISLSSPNQPNIASTYMLSNLNQEPGHRLNTNGYLDVSNSETGTKPKTRDSFEETLETTTTGLPFEKPLPGIETFNGIYKLTYDPKGCELPYDPKGYELELQSNPSNCGNTGNRSSPINIWVTPNLSSPSYTVCEPSLGSMSEVVCSHKQTNPNTRRTPSRKLKELENEKLYLEARNSSLKERVRNMEKSVQVFGKQVFGNKLNSFKNN